MIGRQTFGKQFSWIIGWVLPGLDSWISRPSLLLSSHPGVGVVWGHRSFYIPFNAEALINWEIWIQESIPFSFTVYELVRRTCRESFYLSWRQPFNWCLSCMHNLLVEGHEASDLHPKKNCCDKLRKQTWRVHLIIQFNYTIM